jgi:hypothetical protein
VATSSGKTKHKRIIYVKKAKPTSDDKLVMEATNNKEITTDDNLGKE